MSYANYMYILHAYRNHIAMIMAGFEFGTTTPLCLEQWLLCITFEFGWKKDCEGLYALQTNGCHTKYLWKSFGEMSWHQFL